MTISALALVDGATSLSVTGGTAKQYGPDGQKVDTGIHVSDTTVADFRLKPHITFKNRNPQLMGNGTWQKGVRGVVMTYPYLCTDNIVRFVTTRITTEFAPEIPAATVKNARYVAAQLLFDADLEDYNANGNIL